MISDNIQGWFNCPKLYKEMVDNAKDGAVFVEVGCWKGKSASFMAETIKNSKKKINFYCVDTWKGTLTEHGHQEDPDVVNDRLFEVFNENLKELDGYYTCIRGLSVDGAKQFRNESIDFCYIDGLHEYEPVLRDLEIFVPLVRSGGIVGGHDYSYAPVRTALRDYLRSNLILRDITLFITDEYPPSFFFINP